jgi:hypothetical protein
MKIERQLDQIINENMSAISTGEESLESTLARYPHLETQLRPRLEAAILLQQARFSIATRPGFIHDSRKYLETKIVSMPPRHSWQRIFMRFTPQRWVFNFVAPMIMLLMLALVVNSTLLTARLSIPGDPLYSTKLIIEDLHLLFTFNRLEKTNLHIQQTRERTLEFVELVMEGDYAYLPAAADRMQVEVNASLRSLSAFSDDDSAIQTPMVANLMETLSSEIVMLDILKSTSPTIAHPGINMAIQVAQSGMLSLR